MNYKPTCPPGTCEVCDSWRFVPAPIHRPGVCSVCDSWRRAAEPEPVRARLSPSPQRVWFEAQVAERWAAT